MKHFFLFCIGMVLCPMLCFSQFKYGRVGDDELSMAVYAPDTSAVAVVLYEKGKTSYVYGNSVGFQVLLEVERRVKILKPEGVGYADVFIPCYTDGIQQESLSGLEACSYNKENGKTVKTKLEKKYVFEELASKHYRRYKFSIPNVKAGTVIEYKYRLTSPFYLSIPSWSFQSSIPMQYSTYEVLIPEYFIFNVDASKGFEHIEATDEYENQQFYIGYYDNGQSAMVTSSSRFMTFTARDVPALKVEPYVWCVSDYVTQVSFEISGTKFPNDFYRPYTATWNDIEKTLMDKSDFGTNMKLPNPYKDEVKRIVSEASGEEAIVSGVYALVKEKVRWNNVYAFWGNEARTAAKDGTGDNSQINMLLLSMLRDAGIEAYPVLLSLRSKGRLPYVHPSIDELSTFIVAAKLSDGTCYYMDGSARYGGLNVLPVELQVERAWAFRENVDADTWVDLSRLTRNQHQVSMNVSFDSEGKMNCERMVRYAGQFAYDFKNRYFQEKDSATFVENLGETNNVVIEDYSIEGVEWLSNTVKETILFTKAYDWGDDYVYFSPLVFGHIESNPFKQSERKLPIEFDYLYSYVQTVTINLPEGYAVEEVPKEINLALPERAGVCLYQVKQINDRTLQVVYRFELNKLVFLPEEYASIKEFFGLVAAKNVEPIVLKKL